MNINVKIENEPVIFENMLSKSKGQFLRYFNQIGVSTVEDFLKINESDYPIQSRYFYLAIAHIFRHAYLNQELVYDVILEKKYGEEEKNRYEIAVNDIYRLGLVKLDISKKQLVRILKKTMNDSSFSMRSILEQNPGDILSDNTSGIRSYYIKYLNLKEELEINEYKKNKEIFDLISENENNDEIYSLNELKMHLQVLNDFSKELDQHIVSLQAKINKMEGKNIGNGRK